VTGAPPGSNIIEDSFYRPDQTHWGASTNGDTVTNYSWTGSVAKDTHASIAANRGMYRYENTGKAYQGILGPSVSGQCDILAEVAFADAGQDQFRIFADAAGKNSYGAELDTSSNRLLLFRNVNGVYKTLGSAPFTFSNSALYWIRLDVAAGQIVQTRAWVNGASEPTAWMISVSDSSLSSGHVGVGFSWRSTPLGSGEINESNFAVAGNGTLAIPASAPGSSPSSPLALSAPRSTLGGTLIDGDGHAVTLGGISHGPAIYDANQAIAATRAAGSQFPISVASPGSLVAIERSEPARVPIPVQG
jgi:hypothetical protein